MTINTTSKVDILKPLPAGTVCGWDSEGIYSSATHYFESLLHDIDSAESSIELVVYIFSLDTIGLRVMDALIKACQRQVRVRLLVDGADKVFIATGHGELFETVAGERHDLGSFYVIWLDAPNHPLLAVTMSGNNNELRVCTYNIHKGFCATNRRPILQELRHAIRTVDAEVLSGAPWQRLSDHRALYAVFDLSD